MTDRMAARGSSGKGHTFESCRVRRSSAAKPYLGNSRNFVFGTQIRHNVAFIA